MLLKCPHCSQVKSYADAEFRRIFIQCKGCGKEFRAAECSPLTGREARDRAEVTEMSAPMPVQEGSRDRSVNRMNPGQGEAPPRKGFLNRLLGRSG